jgi:basic amino acid/polyamine antiporter, APA family
VEGAEGASRLRREIGFTGLLAFSVGINIGAGLFVLVNVAAELTGPSMTIAIVGASVPAFVALVPYTALARGYPTTSATYRYIQLASPRLALTFVATVIAAILIGGQPLFARAAGDYLTEVVPIAPVAIGLASLTLFAAVNVWGVKPTAVIQVSLMGALIGALVLYVVLGVGAIESANLTPFLTDGAPGVLVAAGILFALMAGGLFIIDVGEEVIDPRRIFGAVLPLGMLIVLALYAGIFIVTAGAVPASDLVDETLVVAAEQFMSGAPFAVFVIGGALVAAVTTMNITFTLVSRAMFAVSSDGMLPRVFARVHPRTGTPVPAIVAAWAVASAAFVADLPTRFLGTMLNIGLVLAISGVALSGFRLPDRHPQIFAAGRGRISRRLMRRCSAATLAMNAFILLLLFAGAPAAGLTVAAIAGATALVVRLSGVEPAPPVPPVNSG